MQSLVGPDKSAGTSRAESVISSSGVSDSEAGSQNLPHVASQIAFSTVLLPPLVDIAPPPRANMGEREVVTYSKEVQTSNWVDEESSEEEDEEEINRRVEDEVRLKLEKIRMEEQRNRELEAQRLQAEMDIPGINVWVPEWSDSVVMSEEEERRILASDSFYEFLDRSTKIVERTLDEDYDVLADYTLDVEANQYTPSNIGLLT